MLDLFRCFQTSLADYSYIKTNLIYFVNYFLKLKICTNLKINLDYSYIKAFLLSFVKRFFNVLKKLGLYFWLLIYYSICFEILSTLIFCDLSFFPALYIKYIFFIWACQTFFILTAARSCYLYSIALKRKIVNPYFIIFKKGLSLLLLNRLTAAFTILLV